MIDNPRVFLYMALVFLLMLVWMQWQQDYYVLPDQVSTRTAEVPSTDDSTATAQAPRADVPAPNTTMSSSSSVTPSQTNVTESHAGPVIRVDTDIFAAEISLDGANLSHLALLAYPEKLDTPDAALSLFDSQAGHFLEAQSGLQARETVLAPDHHATYRSEAEHYVLGDADELRVPLVWQSDTLKVTKTYVFQRDRYLIDLRYQIENLSDQAVTLNQYRQFKRGPDAAERSIFSAYSYTGGVVSHPEDKYQKYDFSDMEDQDLKLQAIGGWVAMIQHYFTAAWIPNSEDSEQFYSMVVRNESLPKYILGTTSPAMVIEAGSSLELTSSLYAGPKIQSRMEAASPDLRLTVDFGILTILAQPLFWVLNFIHEYIGNWGWSIVILTLLIKLVFYKLSETSYRSMARMRKLQPRLMALRERYGSDRQKMGTATMELYKKEKVNPLGGCLPIVVQIPVFIALYWVLNESVELRQATFALWIKDLSAKDPFFVLPLAMGVTMFIQQKLNPAPVDPIQAKIFAAMPFVFTVFFAFFPSGLVLYWLTNNVLSITQQYYITRHVLAEK